jgi:hypothetical protein
MAGLEVGSTRKRMTHLRHQARRDDECPTHLTRPLSRMLVWPLGILAD